MPTELGGDRIGPLALSEGLRQIGAGSLPLGRLFEGHVNALGLVVRYGDDEQARLVADEAHAGKLFGVWNTDDKEGLRLLADRGRRRLQGRKILASGAGFIERPLVTATDETGRRLMVIPYLQPGRRADLSSWTAHGMRASATGAVDFSGVAVERNEIVGGDGRLRASARFFRRRMAFRRRASLVVVAPHPDDEPRLRRVDRGGLRGGQARSRHRGERRNRLSSFEQGLSEGAAQRSARR